MATIATESRAQTAQRAWEASASKRGTRVELKAQLAAGELALAEAINDERADGITVVDLLRALPGVGRKRAEKLLKWIPVRGSQRCMELTIRQKALVVAEAQRSGR